MRMKLLGQLRQQSPNAFDGNSGSVAALWAFNAIGVARDFSVEAGGHAPTVGADFGCATLCKRPYQAGVC